ncbi:hypothetical protein M2459_002319 [Parabacteroides sp. PF5-5]|nr:hypothetical protein [Parabacteroides sp. PH5-39]MDH6316572.1 hypothetical protein [Parabacteroides sp. PF5-13]MDH6320082.1 hypothetical protein [Parabacteroides sp. PH5-13]MDH6323685.1 hypothetical protein [Parabacteroides sp. PH5-8]MDH6327759.1 hypothetical protein [Parabacteroides sp. PH5-41]MDH6335560.1 hypothetical protein [Parabacteroides sp. PF5-5]MDH6346496.1 hypothetical protein [Parabacteroides sp. PH5-46]MDH6361458.1 hypothetical protein [Parabacteroides sp. PH5-16]MDH6377125.
MNSCTDIKTYSRLYGDTAGLIAKQMAEQTNDWLNG